MFDISWGELILIGMVALIVIGPKELPTVIRTVGQWVTKIRRMAGEFQGQFQDAMREAELAELKKQVESVSDPVKSFTDFNPLNTAKTEIEKAFDEKVTEAAPSAGSDVVPPSNPLPTSPSDTSLTNEATFATMQAPQPASDAARAALDGAPAQAAPAPVADASPAPPREGGRAA